MSISLFFSHLYSKRTGWICLLAVLPGIILSIAVFRLFTLLTGVGDIINYMIAARAILHASDREAWIQAVMNWAPLFPLTLAAIMQWLHPAVIFLLNPALTFGVILLTGAILWCATQRKQSALVTVIIAAYWLMLGLYPNPFAFFMLHPFREPMSFLFLLAGMTAVIAGSRRRGIKRSGWMMAAGACYVLSAGVREPAALAIIGAAVFIVLTPGDSWRIRLFNLLALALPGLVAMAVLAAVFAVTGVFGSRQFHGWQQWVANTSWSAWFQMMRGFLNLTARSFGWTGITLLAIGSVSLAIKHRALLAMLWMAAVLTFLFYSAFAVYPRYVLSFAIFLIPVIGQGLDVLISAISAPFKRKTIHSLLFGITVAGITITGSIRALNLRPMGRVSLRDIRTFNQAVTAHVPPDFRILSDPRSRPLHDALITYLDRPYCNTVPGSHEREEIIYFKPVTHAAITHARVAQSPIRLEELLLETADLVPLCDALGRPVTVHLGKAAYALFEVVPWKERTLKFDSRITRIDNRLLWLDFRNSNSDVQRDIRLSSPEGATLQAWQLSIGNGLIPLWLNKPVQQGENQLIEVSSPSVLPGNITVPPAGSDWPGLFITGEDRCPSVLQWFHTPVHISPYAKWGVIITKGAGLRLPVPAGATDTAFAASLVMQPRFSEDLSIRFDYTASGQTLASYTNALNQGQIRHIIPLPAASGPDVQIQLHINAPTDWQNHFRVLAVGIQPAKE